MFWEIFVNLCNQRNVRPNPVAKELGLSSGSVTKWKSGTTPNDTTLYKIANYFGVTVAYLRGEEENKKDSPENGEPLKEYVVYHRNGKNVKITFTPEQQRIFDALVAGIKPEDEED